MGRKLANSSNCLRRRDIDAGKPAADGRCHRPFQADVRPFDRLGQLFRNVLVIFLESFGAGGEALPFEFDAGGFQDANCCAHDFGADTIAGN